MKTMGAAEEASTLLWNVAALRKKIMSHEAPHGDAGCGCVICLLPRGGGWGELQLEQRLLWMGAGVHRAMRSLGDFVLIGTMRRLPGPGTANAVSTPASASPAVVRRTKTSSGVVVRSRFTGMPLVPEKDAAKAFKDDVEELCREIMGDTVVDDALRARRPQYPGSARQAMRTVPARLSFSCTVDSVDMTVSACAYPQRPFRGSHLLVSTPVGVDIMKLVGGNFMAFDGPIDAKTFWFPNDEKILSEWDEESEKAFMERCHIDMRATSIGNVVSLYIRLRSSTPNGSCMVRHNLPFEFRATLLGREVAE